MNSPVFGEIGQRFVAMLLVHDNSISRIVTSEKEGVNIRYFRVVVENNDVRMEDVLANCSNNHARRKSCGKVFQTVHDEINPPVF